MYAHTKGSRGAPHPLNDHLEAVATRAAAFAQPFGGEEIAYCLGLFHDLGKATQAFQNYLSDCEAGRKPAGKVVHAVWGAWLLGAWFNELELPALSLPVLGHHAGLKSPGEASSVYAAKAAAQELREVAKFLQAWSPELPSPRSPRLSGTRGELFIRMLFSALVDADRLDTEAHFDPEAAQLRKARPNLETLWRRFEANQQALLQKTSGTLVNRIRRTIYEAALQAASLPPGFFRLTAPTGGGKTRTGLAFALKHALEHGLRRVIIAIPYTSIIDQTASEYREILGEDAVLEHHSALEVPDEEEQDPRRVMLRLASENWDHPLIVTTTVQLFESLFSHTPSRVRKLHNLSRAVILIDEVQTLPLELLRPTLDVLRELVDRYGASVVFSTATQPAFELAERVPEFTGVQVREIVPDYPRHFAALRRVHYVYCETPMAWEGVAAEIRARPQVMVVLNTRKDALRLLDALEDDPDVFHLSTLLCPAHRRAVLAEIKKRLGSGMPVRLISTQVVEAGVDLDFPEVWRAVGPLDRIVQAAGRCNREGSPSPGRTVIFTPKDGRVPQGTYRSGLGEAQVLLERYGPEALHEPEIFREYFTRLFSTVDLDKKQIQKLREELNYPEVAARYRLIEQETVPVAVPYEEGPKRLAEFLKRPGRRTWQRLQPYLVNLYRYEVIKQRDCVRKVNENLNLYEWTCVYDAVRGIHEFFADPADLVV
ncbi:CRISPR-associated helicase/endonuclease Cas3 [Marinithermus hydrothermalis]|uniref:Metal dependent phosphohydrolase n=1 Tax=Marinithermus hydrothermalis (strain DSM 14884 / JCM 11576 / T1) TaxID=869210 RepID=F2NNM0_MARHT|nr:CRISPR-associated helicase/endonuclease Cas3 [Marinithermus hydrothermalis]AEB11035.1 metal dependent phosphohydrolase [Marinithermus hydrothermalis DSM 14884]